MMVIVAAWGTGAFDNDDAGDWVYELEGADDLGLCRDALEDAADTNGYLEVREARVAVAAAEVIAAAAGRPSTDLPEAVEAWLDSIRPIPSEDDLALARRAVGRVGSPRSELVEHWARAAPDERSQWEAAVGDLSGRLAS
jgi:hypothetical protein